MSVRIALAGNPNCGKTTMFNTLTGSNQYVGNWPGVTVEKKEGYLKGHNKEVIITDLPGTYSLSPYTLEEVVSRDYLINDKPEAIINLIDGTNIDRNLYLTTQILELGIPVVIALNMMDVVEKNGDKIDVDLLGKKLGCKVVPTSALKGTNLKELCEEAIALAKSKKGQKACEFSKDVEAAINEVSEILPKDICEDKLRRWYSIKLLENDKKVVENTKLSFDVNAKIKEIRENIEKAEDDDIESVIANARYESIADLIDGCIKKKPRKESTSDKIDKIVTNRFLAIPIFVAVMWLVYYISISTIGGTATDFVNDNVFGDSGSGWFWAGQGREAYDSAVEELADPMEIVSAYEDAASEAGEDAATSQKSFEVYKTVDEDSGEVESEEITPQMYHDALDTIKNYEKENPDKMKDGELVPSAFGPWARSAKSVASDFLTKIGTADWIQSLVVDGIIAGVGAVLGFVPQMLVLFFFLAFLEGCGYMARIAFIMDRVFRKFGLSGKSFIPMLIGTGCGVPGIQASRTIENDNDRRMTIMTTTFIPCSAKLPIIAMISGALFDNSAWVATSSYFIGIAAIVVSGIMLKKTKMFAGNPAPFVMELPGYHMPTAYTILHSMIERAWAFIKKAGTVILLATVLIWFLNGFGVYEGHFQMLDESLVDHSILAKIGTVMAFVFKPLGFGNWKFAVAAVTGLIAKENVVGTFGILFDTPMWTSMSNGLKEINANSASLAALAGYAYLVFNLLCAPCFAAIGAIKREMGDAKWTWFAILYQCGFAYVVSFIIYQIGCAVLGNVHVVGLALAVVLAAGIVYMLVRKDPYKNTSMEVKRSVA